VRKLLASGALLVTIGATVAACGSDDSVPSNGVARVGDTVITKSEFETTLNQMFASVAAAAPNQKTKPPVPDPPDFTKCVAYLKKTAPKPAKGQPKTTDAQYKAQCKQQYDSTRDRALQQLISNEWILGEAKDQGVSVSDAEVRKEMNAQIKQFFKKKGQFEQYLKTSGLTRDDIFEQFKINQLTQKIRDKVLKDVPKVNDAQIAAFYKKNKAQFQQPERRNMLIVLAKTKGNADKAKAELESGKSFASVAKKYSIDPSTKTQGGQLNGVAKGQQEKALDQAAFKAKKGALVGPIKTQYGWYVFKVTGSTPASNTTLAKAKPTIRQQLVSQNENKVLGDFAKKFQEDWQGDTNCAKGYVVAQCKNAPKPKTNTAGGTATAGSETGQ
jgi:foldase protein PrsA